MVQQALEKVEPRGGRKPGKICPELYREENKGHESVRGKGMFTS